MRKIFLLTLLLFPILLDAQSCPGPYTIASQEASACVPYPSGLYTTPLPGAGNGGPLNHLLPNSDAMIALLAGEVGQAQMFKVTIGSAKTNSPSLRNTSSNAQEDSQAYFYGNASDPLWTFDCTSGPNAECRGDLHTGFQAHVPNGAHFSNLTAHGAGDSWMVIWDQVSNEIIELHANDDIGINHYANRYFQTSNCCTKNMQFLSGTARLRTTLPDYGVNSSYSIHAAPTAPTARAHEWATGFFHAFLSNTRCENDSGALFVFPADAGSGVTGCGGNGVSNTNRPVPGHLIFGDWTDAQIAALPVNAAQKAVIWTLSHYGSYVTDTCGPTSTCNDIINREGDVAYNVANIANPAFQYFLANGINPTTSSAPDAPVQTYTVSPFTGVPNWASHLHVADPCVAKGMAGVAGGCGTVLTFLTQPTTTSSGSVMSSVTVISSDPTFAGQVTLNIGPCGAAANNNVKTASLGRVTFDTMTMSGFGTGCVFTPASPNTSATPSVPFNVTDAIPPVPGGGGTVTVSALSSGTLTLSWTKATDNVSAQNQLQYEVCRSGSIISTVAACEAATVIQPFTLDIATFGVTGLTPSTLYHFNVVAQDVSGNKALYADQTATTTGTADTTPPVPGSTGTITVSNLATLSLTLNWTRATDDVTPQNQLQYEVCRSDSAISTIAACESAILIKPFTTDIITFAVTGLSAATIYHFNVVATDVAGNKALYTDRVATTTGDTVPPVPGVGVVVSGITNTQMTLSWTRATDNVTAQPQLQYEVCKSLTNTVTEVSGCEAAIIQAFTADLTSFIATGLSGSSTPPPPVGTVTLPSLNLGNLTVTAVNASGTPSGSTTYYFNVVVRDTAGNKAHYTSAVGVTK